MVAAYSVWWLVTARMLESRIAAWIAEQQAAGATIAPPTVSIGGYPIALTAAIDGVALKWPTGFGFTSQHVRVSTHPWALHSFRVAVTGGFGFALPAGSSRPALTVAGETLRGGALFADTALPLELKLTADGVSATRTDTESQPMREMIVATLDFAATRPETAPAQDTDVGLVLTLHLIDTSAAVLDGNPLGGTIADTAIEAKIMGPLPASPDAAGLTAWRDKGGTIELDRLALGWGPLHLAAKGTVALDAQMQPEGAFTAHLTGYDKTIDALAGAGWLKPGPASLAKLALGITARPGPDGQPAVDAPLTIQNRRLSLGPAKLGEIPALKLD